MSAVLGDSPTIASRAMQVLDPDLPILAARAAVEVDRLVQGRPPEKGDGSDLVSDALTKFAEMIDAIGVFGVSGVSRALDPVSSRVFADAFASAHNGHCIQTYAQLFEKARELAAQMRLVSENKFVEKDVLLSLRSFLISLSNYSAAQRQALVGRPAKSHRR